MKDKLYKAFGWLLVSNRPAHLLCVGVKGLPMRLPYPFKATYTTSVCASEIHFLSIGIHADARAMA